jgi:hypothetical protein
MLTADLQARRHEPDYRDDGEPMGTIGTSSRPHCLAGASRGTAPRTSVQLHQRKEGMFSE